MEKQPRSENNQLKSNESGSESLKLAKKFIADLETTLTKARENGSVSEMSVEDIIYELTFYAASLGLLPSDLVEILIASSEPNIKKAGEILSDPYSALK